MSKVRQEKTLQGMKDRRKADYIFLRDIVEKKLKWAENEKELGHKTIQNVTKQILRLEGIILVLKELVEASEESVGKKEDIK